MNGEIKGNKSDVVLSITLGIGNEVYTCSEDICIKH